MSKCLHCKQLYKISEREYYFNCWCKEWESYLLKDEKNLPIQCKPCKEMEELGG